MPDPDFCRSHREPRIKATDPCADEYLGDVLKLCQDRRGMQIEPGPMRAQPAPVVVYDLRAEEVVFDFYDRLKCVNQGLCLLSTTKMIGYREDAAWSRCLVW